MLTTFSNDLKRKYSIPIDRGCMASPTKLSHGSGKVKSECVDVTAETGAVHGVTDLKFPTSLMFQNMFCARMLHRVARVAFSGINICRELLLALSVLFCFFFCLLVC